MYGSTTVVITQVDGRSLSVKFTIANTSPLYIRFNATRLDGSAIDSVFLRNQLLAQLQYTIAQRADTTTIISFAKQILGDVVVSSEGVSTDGTTYVNFVDTPDIFSYFTLTAAHISINGITG